jgi:hypothetical protein
MTTLALVFCFHTAAKELLLKSRNIILTAILGWTIAPVTLYGGTISSPILTNDSSANSATSGGSVDRSFQTSSVALGPVQTAGNDVSFTSQFSWQNAIRVQPGGATAALISSRLTAYLLTFDVEDPLNQGYTLDVDTMLRGYATSTWESGGTISAAPGSISGRIDTDMDDATDTLVTQISNLTVLTSGASATSTNPFANVLVSGSKSYSAGSFSGTRSFGLRFTTFGSTASVFLANNSTGEAGARFGLDPSPLANFPSSAYAGVDGEAAALHGHFVTVTATFNPVPEPSSAILFGLGVCMFILRWRRR